MNQKKKLRCAIYTRKSTEEGLDQAFNSLDAQREACAAYALSQKGEGWSVLPTLYDDGGFSGGSMERPALARLLADVQSGKVDRLGPVPHWPRLCRQTSRRWRSPRSDRGSPSSDGG